MGVAGELTRLNMGFISVGEKELNMGSIVHRGTN